VHRRKDNEKEYGEEFDFDKVLSGKMPQTESSRDLQRAINELMGTLLQSLNSNSSFRIILFCSLFTFVFFFLFSV